MTVITHLLQFALTVLQMIYILALPLYVSIVLFCHCAVLTGMTSMPSLKALRHILVVMTLVGAYNLVLLVGGRDGDEVVDLVDSSDDALIVETAQVAVLPVQPPSSCWTVLSHYCGAPVTFMLAFQFRIGRVDTAVFYQAILAMVASIVAVETVRKRVVGSPTLVAQNLGVRVMHLCCR